MKLAIASRLRRALRNTVRAEGCKSGYIAESGKIVNNWSGFTFTYRRLTGQFDFVNYQAPAAATNACLHETTNAPSRAAVLRRCHGLTEAIATRRRWDRCWLQSSKGIGSRGSSPDRPARYRFEPSQMSSRTRGLELVSGPPRGSGCQNGNKRSVQSEERT
jgi:hypothetical protein